MLIDEVAGTTACLGAGLGHEYAINVHSVFTTALSPLLFNFR